MGERCTKCCGTRWQCEDGAKMPCDQCDGYGQMPDDPPDASEHDWTFDPHHQAHRCKACGKVSYAADHDGEPPDGPCSPSPSRWVPPGASEPEPADPIEAMLERAGERYRASLAEPLDAEAEAQLQRQRVRLGLDGGGE